MQLARGHMARPQCWLGVRTANGAAEHMIPGHGPVGTLWVVLAAVHEGYTAADTPPPSHPDPDPDYGPHPLLLLGIH